MAEAVKSQIRDERRRNRRKTKINASANNNNDNDVSKEKLGNGDAASLKEDAVNDGASDYDDDEEEEDECVICMEPFHPTLNPRMPTACGCGDNKTYFHLPCLLTWVERDVTCPGCRERLIWQEFG